jgi:hypothetical protein
MFNSFCWEVVALQERERETERERESTQTRLLEGCVLWRGGHDKVGSAFVCLIQLCFIAREGWNGWKRGLFEWELFHCESCAVFWCWSHVSQF